MRQDIYLIRWLRGTKVKQLDMTFIIIKTNYPFADSFFDVNVAEKRVLDVSL